MNLSNAHRPILGFAALSGTGKTTLLVTLLTILKERGHRVGVVKHAHHSFDIDKPGKDSYELRKAGATQMLVASSERWALVTEQPRSLEPRLNDVLRHLDQESLDCILVEGFKAERFPKIELHRSELDRPFLHVTDDSIIAIATDVPSRENHALPVLDLNQPEQIADFIVDYFFGARPYTKQSVQEQTCS